MVAPHFGDFLRYLLDETTVVDHHDGVGISGFDHPAEDGEVVALVGEEEGEVGEHGDAGVAGRHGDEGVLAVQEFARGWSESLPVYDVFPQPSGHEICVKLGVALGQMFEVAEAVQLPAFAFVLVRLHSLLPQVPGRHSEP